MQKIIGQQDIETVLEGPPDNFVPSNPEERFAYNAWKGLVAQVGKEKATEMVRKAQASKKAKDLRGHKITDLGQAVFVIPSIDYFRCRQMDPGFWKDTGSVKLYRRNNPDLFIPNKDGSMPNPC